MKRHKPETRGPRVECFQLRAEGKKRCRRCLTIKVLAEFNIRNREREWYKHWCRDCEKAHFHQYYRKNQAVMQQRARDYFQEWKLVRFQAVLDALGSVCACCGENDPTFLTVDHIQNDGWKDRIRKDGTKHPTRRSGRALWSKIRNEGYPKDRYRILCFNCNCGRERSKDKKCPHERLTQTRLVLVS